MLKSEKIGNEVNKIDLHDFQEGVYLITIQNENYHQSESHNFVLMKPYSA